ncbi:MAG: hypothetical protein U0931_41040 [Vulcanimicrobiota bacterium]
MITRALLFCFVFVATVIWRFPYEEAIADRIAALEARTGTQVDYTPESAGMSGVEWKDVSITTRSGIKVRFDQAKLRPTLRGMSAQATQGKGQGRLVMEPNGDLSLRMDQLKFDSGSKVLGEMTVSGNVTHSFRQRRGEGNLRLVLEHHNIPLPVEVESFETGNHLFWQDRGVGYEVNMEVKLTGGADITADGNLKLEPNPGGPHRLNGSLNVQTRLGLKGRLIPTGTWKDIQWTMVRDT